MHEVCAGLPSISGAELLSWRRDQLQQGGEASSLDWLLEMQAGVSWRQLQRLRLDQAHRIQLQSTLEELAELWQRHRHGHEPLQYLVGRCPWRDLELSVGPGVLIPRQETELLVELALERGATAAEGNTNGGTPQQWADLGTGSGCLAVALARAWPASQGMAVDTSLAALNRARLNLRRHALEARVRLLQGNWWQPLQPFWGRLELVVSNPPYIPTATWRGLDPVVLQHEPELALHAGADGLDAIRTIVAGAIQALAPGGWLILEHHHDQSLAVRSLLRQAGLDAVQATADLEGQQRFASGRRPPQR